ncbi:uncharacterized protein si:dkey-29h14.10 [Lampris incognitus]|uniref:uncharacterized protein si:dkey-29h14.10 n=1 Tax=Lampris incognitus TaxID=2546036 RepID=UPI0024B51B17|nr:uncharacterized protein si:dkey-29h14.10 [Lampris incognitus]
MHRLIPLLQTVLDNGRKACQLFCGNLETFRLFYRDYTAQPELLEDSPSQVQTLTSTTLIINISNSTLSDCVIGNVSFPAAVVDKEPLMMGSELHMHASMTCNCSCKHQMAANTSVPLLSEELHRVCIQDSHLNCVIIGDNNSMRVE